jgi:hypothetical protein
MKNLITRILVWSWIASLFGCLIAIYSASWQWTLALLAYAMVTVVAAGFIRASSKGATAKGLEGGPLRRD